MQALQTAHACNVARHATSWADALNQRCPQHCIRVVLNIASVTSSTLHQWRPQQCISDVLNIASVASSTVHQGCPQQCIRGVLNSASGVSSTVHQWCPQHCISGVLNSASVVSSTKPGFPVLYHLRNNLTAQPAVRMGGGGRNAHGSLGLTVHAHSHHHPHQPNAKPPSLCDSICVHTCAYSPSPHLPLHTHDSSLSSTTPHPKTNPQNKPTISWQFHCPAAAA